jgi:hypothetical protein
MKGENEESQVGCAKCERTFNSKAGLAVHNSRMHRGKAKAQKKAAKLALPPQAQTVVINFCSHCGHRIPNAYMVVA